MKNEIIKIEKRENVTYHFVSPTRSVSVEFNFDKGWYYPEVIVKKEPTVDVVVIQNN